MMNNEEIIALIPSRAVREYLRKIGHRFDERERELLSRYLTGEEPTYQGDYVSVPNPFRSGDMVTFANKPNEKVGILTSAKDDESWRKFDERCRTQLKGCVDWSDVATRVEFLMGDGTFSHSHPNPLYLEYATIPDGDPRKNVLEIASELLRGTESSVELLQMYCKQYANGKEQ